MTHDFNQCRMLHAVQQKTEWAPDACGGDAVLHTLRNFTMRTPDCYNISIQAFKTIREAASDVTLAAIPMEQGLLDAPFPLHIC